MIEHTSKVTSVTTQRNVSPVTGFVRHQLSMPNDFLGQQILMFIWMKSYNTLQLARCTGNHETMITASHHQGHLEWALPGHLQQLYPIARATLSEHDEDTYSNCIPALCGPLCVAVTIETLCNHTTCRTRWLHNHAITPHREHSGYVITHTAKKPRNVSVAWLAGCLLHARCDHT